MAKWAVFDCYADGLKDTLSLLESYKKRTKYYKGDLAVQAAIQELLSDFEQDIKKLG